MLTDTPALILGAAARHRVGHLLEDGFVVVDAVEPAFTEAVVGVHAVDLELEVGAAAAEGDQSAGLRGGAAANVVAAHRHARQHVADRLEVAPGRNRVEQLAVDHLAPRGVLDVDDRRLAGDRHRLGDRADAHLHVDWRREVGVEHDALAFDTVEPLKRKRHRIRPGAQIDHAVLTRLIGDGGPRLLYERRTRYFHGDTRQDARRGVTRHAGNRALRAGNPGSEHAPESNEYFQESPGHISSFVN